MFTSTMIIHMNTGYPTHWLKRLLLAVLCWSFGVSASATTPEYLDSIKRRLKTTDNIPEKLNCLYTLSYEYGSLNPVLGIEYGNACLKLAVQEKNLPFQLNAYNGIANSWEGMSNYDSALFYHRKTYEIAKTIGSTSKIGLTLINQGLCYKKLGYYKTALNAYLKGYDLIKDDSVYNYRIHFYLGEIYLRLGDYQEAEEHSRLGLKYLLGTPDEYVAYNLQVNLAKCYLAYGQIDSAIALLKSTLVGLKKNIDSWSIGLCYNALAMATYANRAYEDALRYHQMELLEHEKIENQNGMLLANLNIAFVYTHLPNSQKIAREYFRRFEQLLVIAPKNNDVLLEAYEIAAKTAESIGLTEKALAYYKLFFNLKNTILGLEKNLQLQELQLKYETEKKEREIIDLKRKDAILQLELKNKEANLTQRNYLIFIGLLVVLFAGVLIFVLFKRHREKTRLRHALEIKMTEEKERLRMAKDLHDDLGSGLSKISFLSKRMPKQNAEVESEYIEVIGETAENLIVNMRELIWVLTPENITISGIIVRIREYSTDYLDDFPLAFYFNAAHPENDFPITTDSHRHFLMVVKEALNNIIKHARATQINIDITLDDQAFTMTINDNGKGIPPEHHQGNGLLNMKTRIAQIGGQFDIMEHHPSGTRLRASCPLTTIKRH